MDTGLRDLIAGMNDEDVVRLAVAVREALDDDSAESALASLTPDSARSFLDAMERLAGELSTATDRPAAVACARSFLVALLELEVFDALLAERLVDAGVRLNLGDVFGWFSGKFNVASLIGISFEYGAERVEVKQTESGSVETRRTIKIGIGTSS